MRPNRYMVDLLWQRLEQAKQELDFAHQRAILIHEDKLSGAIPPPDGLFAHGNVLRAEVLAVKNYLGALEEFKVALSLDRRAGDHSEPSQDAEAANGTHQAAAGITRREREVLALIAGGQSSKQIAAQLGMAFRTAVCHRYRIQKKLQAHNTADLTRAALRMGLIEL